jgi:nucleotide sugar dehydrogenase
MLPMMDMKRQEIAEAVRRGELTVTAVGLGRMGLPTACLFAEAGVRVVGADIDRYVVETVGRGESPFAEPGLNALLKKHIHTKRITVTLDVRQAASQSDVILIAVPTGVDTAMRPDYSAVERACREVGRGLRDRTLVIFESTVGPGITEGLVKGAIENASGLKAGSNFGLAYSPIRAAAGSALRDIASYPRIIGAYDPRSMEAASAVLGFIVRGGLVSVSSLKAAEAAKLFENVYRDVNIALANELAVFCERSGLDFNEIGSAANTQPFSHIHRPGVGVGGECIPVNPYFLLAQAEEANANLGLARLARKVNDAMPQHTVRLVRSALRSCGKPLRRSKISVLGLSYKANVKEERGSPATTIIRSLAKKGAIVSVFDPNYTSDELKRLGYTSVPSLDRTVEGADCIVVTVAHDQFKDIRLEKFTRLIRRPAAIVDGARAFDPEKAEKAGFIYRGIGRG